MGLDLCLPAYNEEDIILASLKRLIATLDSSLTMPWRIIVSVNGSTDRTAELTRGLGDARVSVIECDARGKGVAIREAAHASFGDYFGFIDADLSANPSDIAALLGFLTNEVADIAIGSRLIDTRTVKRGRFRTASSLLFNTLRRFSLGIHVEDSQCGLKLMNARARKVLESCTENGWFLDLEFLARSERSGLRIREVPVHWDEASFANRASKLRVVRDGIQGVKALLRIRRQLLRNPVP